MSTLYRAVLIESAEQAEALPVGTVAILGWGLGSDIRTRTSNGWITRTGSVLPSADVVGWTALVPISVEDLIRDTVAEALAEQARQEAEADKKRQEFNAEVRRRAEEQYLTRPYPATQFNRLGEP